MFYAVNSISTIFTSYASATPTVTISLTPCPISALASGDSFEILPLTRSVSKEPTIVYFSSSGSSKDKTKNVTVVPGLTTFK